jgi:hypothetical protein
MIKTLYDDRFLVLQVLVIIDAKPKDLGLPTEAYVAVEEVHDVSIIYLMINLSLFMTLHNCVQPLNLVLHLIWQCRSMLMCKAINCRFRLARPC